MPRTFTVLLAEDDSRLGAESIQDDFDADCSVRSEAAGGVPVDRLVVYREVQVKKPGEVVQLATSKDPPDVILLDDHLQGRRPGEPERMGFAVMCAITRYSEASGVDRPLTVLHTTQIDALFAYSFRCAGGHHVVDKQRLPDFAERIALLWRVLDGERWAPAKIPPDPELKPNQAALLPYLTDPSIEDDEIAVRLGLTNAKSVNNLRRACFDALFPGERDANPKLRVDVTERRRMAAKALNGGHVWVPLHIRSRIFGGVAFQLPFDGPGVIARQEPSRR